MGESGEEESIGCAVADTLTRSSGGNLHGSSFRRGHTCTRGVRKCSRVIQQRGGGQCVRRKPRLPVCGLPSLCLTSEVQSFISNVREQGRLGVLAHG